MYLFHLQYIKSIDNQNRPKTDNIPTNINNVYTGNFCESEEQMDIELFRHQYVLAMK